MDRMPDVTFATEDASDSEPRADEGSDREEEEEEEEAVEEGNEADECDLIATKGRDVRAHLFGTFDSSGLHSSDSDNKDNEDDEVVQSEAEVDEESDLVSRVRASGTRGSPAVLQGVYNELNEISSQLKIENRLLHERELRLKTREEEIERAYKKLASVIHRSADEKCSQVEMKAKEKIRILSGQLKEKCRENRRLRSNFDALRSANDELKKQLETLQNQHEVLEKQAANLRQRLENLQRVQQFKDKQTEDLLSELKPKLNTKNAILDSQRTKKIRKSSGAAPPALYDALSLALEWIVRDVLAPSCSRNTTLDAALRFRIVDSAQQLTPLVVRRLRDDTEAAAARLGLPSLQFIYWSCQMADRCDAKQNTTFVATMRHLCEELYRPVTASSCEDVDRGVTAASIVADGHESLTSDASCNRSRLTFVKSPDPHIRLLSCLLLLKNLSQADLIANTFDLLKSELKAERSKELFVYYQGTSVILQYFKPTAKVHLGAVLDVCMLLAVESTVTPAFLESCGCEAWFRSCAMVLKIPNLDERLFEKISVILQKLSKIRSNRKHFDMFQLKGAVQDMMRTVSSDSNSFTVLNCKSILFNLS